MGDSLLAQESSESGQAKEVEAAPKAPLSERQQELAEKYIHLEEVLLRMAEIDATDNPHRQGVIKKALGQGKERMIATRMESLVELLSDEQFTKAIENQEAIEQELRQLLQLLESENRSDERKSEKEQIRRWLQQIDQLIHRQKSLKGRTASKESKEKLAEQQKQLGEETGKLSEEMSKDPSKDTGSDEQESGPSPQRDGEENPSESSGEADSSKQGESGEGKKDESEKEDSSKPEDQETSNADEKASDQEDEDPSGKKSREKNDDSKQSDASQDPSSKKSSSSPSSSPSSNEKDKKQNTPSSETPSSPQHRQEEGESSKSPPSPTRKSLQEAQQRMRAAEEALRKAQRDEAEEAQEEAIAELERARAELAEILRQLREEEMMQLLEWLDVRFARMLRMQENVLRQTQSLRNEAGLQMADEGTPKEHLPELLRDPPKQAEEAEPLPREFQIRSNRLSAEEKAIVEQADAALLLLRDDGTAQAMEESLQQTRFDMSEVVTRFSETKLDRITVVIQQDIIESLREMIEAVQKAKKDQEKKQQKPQQNSRPMKPGERPLIDILVELKMIRTMQKRVNDRTERYEQYPRRDAADRRRLAKAVEELSRQQRRIHEILHDLEVGRNR
jgi:hypothetical protein